MKKYFILSIMIIVLIIFTQNVFAENIIIDTDQTPDNPGSGTTIQGVADVTKDAWATVVVIVQIVSVACVVFAGLRYMFASADQKADIKQGLIYLAIGAILVFGATTVIQFVVDAANEIIS